MRHLLFLPYFVSTSLFGVVSIAPVDIGSKVGFSGNISGLLSSKSGNTEKNEYALGLRLQYDHGSDYLAWGTFTYNYGESKGSANEDKTYGHIRYIHALTDTKEFTSELFVQSEQDRFKDIKERSLAGAGVRWRFFNSDTWGKGYTGGGAFIEKIGYTDPSISAKEENNRFNLYLAYKKSFMHTSSLNYLGYYQPKIDDASDFVSTQTLELIVPIYGNLGLNMSAKYTFDSRPPIGIKKNDSAYTTSLQWEF